MVYATAAELIPAPGSHATAPPTAATAKVTATATLRLRSPRQILLKAPMEGSLPPSGAGR
ncbi:hypothetical protein GCM10010256_05410 [Streptomyces coeruleorubidus]|nr:hypothetical protein GCM10010256_05410 [Streptomyces coeruleorubidus]